MCSGPIVLLLLEGDGVSFDAAASPIVAVADLVQTADDGVAVGVRQQARHQHCCLQAAFAHHAEA